MAGVVIRLDAKSLGLGDDVLRRLDPLHTQPLMTGLARLVQMQTRRRILSEKTSPSGQAWVKNRTGTSILYRSGALARSVDYLAGAMSFVVGSGLIYARIHQFGGVITPKKARALVFSSPGGGLVFTKKVTIPPRPWLGVSAGNASEILEAVADFIRRKLG